MPAAGTRATLAGPLCGTEACRCKTEDGDAGQADGDAKRFEIRLGPAEHALWAEVDDMVLYKSRERATDCFYLDLRPGVHKVTVRGQNETGVGFQAHVSEEGGNATQPWWYATLSFACGGPGMCDGQQLADFKQSLAGKKGKLDPCGSTRITEVEWMKGRMPDMMHPDDLLLRFNLQVYAFVPEHPPGDEACAK